MEVGADGPVTTGDTPRTSARYEFSDLVPEGESVIGMEREGQFVMFVRPGEMSPACMAAINKHLEHLIGNGLWTQRWSGQLPPHPADEP